MKKYKFALLFILGLGLALRLWKLNIPLLEFYPTRQVQTAEITQNLIKDNFNFLYPRVDYFGPENIYYLIEFPGYNLVVAAVDNLSGKVSDLNGRIVSIFSYLIATIFLYKIASGIFNKQIGLIAIFFFTLSPLNVLTSRSFQPDEMMLASSLGAIYYLLMWKKKGSWKFILFSYLFFAWAVLIKVVAAVFLFLPIIYILYMRTTKKQKQSFFTSKFLPAVYLLASLFPCILWHLHSFEVSTRLNTASSTAFNLFIWFGPANLINPKYYSTIFGYEYNLVILPVGMVLFLIGLGSKLTKNQLVAYWWLAGVVVYFLFFNKHSMTHEYYHLPFLPVASIFVALGFNNIFKNLKDLNFNKTYLMIVTLLLILVSAMLVVTSRAYKPIERFSDVVNAGKAIQGISSENDLIVGIMDRGPTIEYYSNRIGWHFGLDVEEQKKEEEFYTNSIPNLLSAQERLETFIKKGAKFLVIGNSEEFKKDRSFENFVYNNFDLVDNGEKYLIFSLEK